MIAPCVSFFSPTSFFSCLAKDCEMYLYCWLPIYFSSAELACEYSVLILSFLVFSAILWPSNQRDQSNGRPWSYVLLTDTEDIFFTHGPHMETYRRRKSWVSRCKTRLKWFVLSTAAQASSRYFTKVRKEKSWISKCFVLWQTWDEYFPFFFPRHGMYRCPCLAVVVSGKLEPFAGWSRRWSRGPVAWHHLHAQRWRFGDESGCLAFRGKKRLAVVDLLHRLKMWTQKISWRFKMRH